MAEVTLPAQMQYFPPAVAARARSYRQTITPMNGSQFKGNDKMKFVLGTTPGTYLNTLNSYIEFDIYNTTASADQAQADKDTLAIDGHASCLFDRIEVYHAGALIDQLNTANVLYSTLLDAGVSMVDAQSTHITGGIADMTGTENEAMYTYKGRQILASPTGTKEKIHVAFSLVGLLSPAGLDRYLPLGDAVNGNVEIHIYLASNEQGMQAPLAGAVNPTWQIENAEYQATLVEIDAAVHAALVQSIGGIYSLPYNSWRHYSNNILTGATSHTFYIATKVSSLSGMVVTMRDNTALNSSATASISQRTRAGLKSAQLRIGALNFPLKPMTTEVANGDQALIESLKMFGKLGSSMGGTSLSRKTYLGDGGTAKGDKFFISFDTQAYSAASAAVDDGVQAQHGSTYLQLEFTSGAPTTTICDVYVLFDGMLTVANGAISAAF